MTVSATAVDNDIHIHFFSRRLTALCLLYFFQCLMNTNTNIYEVIYQIYGINDLYLYSIINNNHIILISKF